MTEESDYEKHMRLRHTVPAGTWLGQDPEDPSE